MMRVVLGTRGSELARTQTHWVADRLRAAAPDLVVEIRVIRTKGDHIRDVPLAKIGAKGVFTKELELALLDGEIDAAVHSLKDLPTDLPEGLALAAIPERASPRDFLVTRDGHGLDALPAGARLGTSSLRRAAQIRALRPDIALEDIRGNVGTRAARVTGGSLDATILAEAGLQRLGMTDLPGQPLDPEIFVPAVGQGALGIEIRADGEALAECFARLAHPETQAAASAERALLHALGGGCQTPLGALGQIVNGRLRLHACLCGEDGGNRRVLTLEGAPEAPEALGEEAARELRAPARVISLPPQDRALAGTRIAVTRDEEGRGRFRALLEAKGAAVFSLPLLSILPPESPPDLPAIRPGDWAVFTSRNAVRHFGDALAKAGRGWTELRGAHVCAIGPATAEALRGAGVLASLTPAQFDAATLLETLEAIEGGVAGKRFILPRGNLARPELPEALAAAGAEVLEIIVYRTAPRRPEAGEFAALRDFDPTHVLFTSASAAESFADMLPDDLVAFLNERAAFGAIGPVTAEAARRRGIPIALQPDDYTLPGLAEAVAAHARSR